VSWAKLRLENLPAPSRGRKLGVLVLSLLAGFAAMSIVFAARVNPLFAFRRSCCAPSAAPTA
jgi:hypothetical protein